MRSAHEPPEFEVLDTGAFDDDRYWQITAEYAKAAPDDVLVRVLARNAGPESAELHILPTLWFRNRWSWEDGVPKPVLRDVSNETGSVVIAEDENLGAWKLAAGPDPTGRPPSLLFCDNETNLPKLFGGAAATPYPKDGVNDHVGNGAATVNPERSGTKMACWPPRYGRSRRDCRDQVPAGPRHSRQNNGPRGRVHANASRPAP
jgi:hypothetical protein